MRALINQNFRTHNYIYIYIQPFSELFTQFCYFSLFSTKIRPFQQENNSFHCEICQNPVFTLCFRMNALISSEYSVFSLIFDLKYRKSARFTLFFKKIHENLTVTAEFQSISWRNEPRTTATQEILPQFPEIYPATPCFSQGFHSASFL